MFLAGWDAVLDTRSMVPLQRIRVVDAPAVLGWQRWQELNAQYTLANIEAGLVRLLEQGVLAPHRWRRWRFCGTQQSGSGRHGWRGKMIKGPPRTSVEPCARVCSKDCATRIAETVDRARSWSR